MKKVAVFGTGFALIDLISILPADVSIVALGDNNPALHGTVMYDRTVLPAEAFVDVACDRIIIAARASDAIRQQLVTLGAPAKKISAYYPSYSASLQAHANEDIATLNSELGLDIPAVGISTMYMWPERDPVLRDASAEDFVRKSAFRLVAARIHEAGIQGAIGELGVYKGELASILNRLFPKRALHLFDTFEGFSTRDLPAEKQGQFSMAKQGEFSDTSIDTVLAKMIAPEQISIHKGYFPDTAVGLEETFALVSLDVDLYAPTHAGLEWFYPRLAKGGYLFVHDYNNRRYQGVRKAVDEFVVKFDARVMPLPDFAGSIVVVK
jgi:O-methyltransferase